MPTPSTLRGALLACALLIACAVGPNGTDGTTAAARWNDDARCLVAGRTREQSCADDRSTVSATISSLLAGW